MLRFIARSASGALLLGVMSAAHGCSSSTDPVVPPTEAEALYASKVAALAVAVATAHRGTSFFDNFIPCARRGVINFAEGSDGARNRIAQFSGCDTGDGVVVDGAATIASTPSGADASAITGVTLNGNLQVAGPDGARTITTLAATNVSFRIGTDPVVQGLVVENVRVRLGGAEFPMDARADPHGIFEPGGLNTSSIPNSENSLAALTDADLKRIAFHSALVLVSVLFNETSEARAAHTHDLPCGTMQVTASGQGAQPRLTNHWQDCPAGSLFVSGDFVLEWAELDQNSGRMAMLASGEIVLGGGTPRLALTRLEWTVSGIRSLPAVATFSGRLVTATGERRYSFTVPVDD
jgi:hypothetical protein